MAQHIPPDDFAELEALAQALLDHARALTAGHAIVAAGAPVEEIALTEEVQAYASAAQALARVTPLGPPALFTGFGAAVGVILAQQDMPHAELLRLMRDQERRTYDEVIRASTPPTRTVQ
jgi:hypothetical protein